MQPVAIAHFGFNGVAKGMAKIENGANSGFAFVFGHYPCLGLAGALDSFGQCRRVQLDELLHMLLKPVHERGITNQAVLYHLGQPGRKLARWQCAQGIGINNHGFGLVEGTNHVLAQLMVDTGLAAYRGIHLRQQCGRHLNETDATLVAGSGKAGHVSGHSTAQRNQRGLAIMTILQQAIKHLLQGWPVLVRLAIRQDDFRQLIVVQGLT